MKLTNKDKEFLDRLKAMFARKELSVEINSEGLKRMVLRQNYGDKVEAAFGMTRQGVRWRFNRLFNEIYVNAYITILWVESNFGIELREKAMEIATERVTLYKKVQKMSCPGVYRRETRAQGLKARGARL